MNKQQCLGSPYGPLQIYDEDPNPRPYIKRGQNTGDKNWTIYMFEVIPKIF